LAEEGEIMTDFTPSEVELAQWLEETVVEEGYNDWSNRWLLTAREIRKKVLAEIDVVQNKYCLDTDNEGKHCHDVDPPCDMCDAFEELKLHFSKGEDK
jgi:hypothetical protein